jgi:hypothetical protein
MEKELLDWFKSDKGRIYNMAEIVRIALKNFIETVEAKK